MVGRLVREKYVKLELVGESSRGKLYFDKKKVDFCGSKVAFGIMFVVLAKCAVAFVYFTVMTLVFMSLLKQMRSILTFC